MNFKKKSIISIMLALILGFTAIVTTTYAREQSGDEPFVWEDDVFVISEDLELHIPFIQVGEEVLVGRLNLEQGQIYHVSVEAAEGISVFLGVKIDNSSTNHPFFVGAEWFWSPFSSRGDAGSVARTITHCGRQGYLFVGSSPFSNFPTDLTDVTVRITMLPEYYSIENI